MPAAWQSHPVVRQGAAEGGFVLPVALFIDAAKFGGQAAGRNKSIYNFTCVQSSVQRVVYVAAPLRVGAVVARLSGA
eukprot:7139167-Pyramimonas_sp.AAC.1